MNKSGRSRRMALNEDEMDQLRLSLELGLKAIAVGNISRDVFSDGDLEMYDLAKEEMTAAGQVPLSGNADWRPSQRLVAMYMTKWPYFGMNEFLFVIQEGRSVAVRRGWNASKVIQLCCAIRSKDIGMIYQLVAFYGKGRLPDRVYGRGYSHEGPASVLAAAIGSDDVKVFRRLLALGMDVDDLQIYCRPDLTEDDLFGRKGERNPEILVVLAGNGFDFSPFRYSSQRLSISAFIARNATDIELLERLEKAGLRYYYYDWAPDEGIQIPWKLLLNDMLFDAMNHFQALGYKPEERVCLQIGTKDCDPGSSVDAWCENHFRYISVARSVATIDYVCDHEIQVSVFLALDKMTSADFPILRRAIERHVKIDNPEAILETSNDDIIGLALELRVCEV